MNDKKYQLFVDLDGVLVDFEHGVEQATGQATAEILPRIMWPILARTPDFYAKLHWLDEGRKLWDQIQEYQPVILTGLPSGRWADPQKRLWCSRELGNSIPVITGPSKNKALLARQWLEEHAQADHIPILIDDRVKMRAPWEEAGGVFILHLASSPSLRELKSLGA